MKLLQHFIIIAFLFVYSLSGCNNETESNSKSKENQSEKKEEIEKEIQTPESDLILLNIKGQISHIDEYVYELKSNEEVAIKHYSFDFNEKGNFKSRIDSTIQGAYKYDFKELESGVRTFSKINLQYDIEEESREFFFNEEGKLDSLTIKGPEIRDHYQLYTYSGSKTETITTIYPANKNKVLKDTPKERLISSFTYKEGKEIETVEGDNQPYKLTYITKKNEFGDPISFEVKENDIIQYTETFDYVYDEQNNWIEKHIFYNGEKILIHKRIIK